MALSVGNYRLTLQQMVDHAVARCKIPRQRQTGEHQVIAREVLGFALAELSNKTVPLWCQERVLLPLYQQEREVSLPPGTVDILPDSCFWRTSARVGATYSTDSGGTATSAGDGDFNTALTQTAPNGSVIVQFSSPTVVNLVGVLPNGDQWHNLEFEASNDGSSWTRLMRVGAPFGQEQTFYADARWAWYEIASPAAGGSAFFRARETGGGVLDLRELYLGTATQDLPMARLNREQYLTLPNKTFVGRPLQFWLSRDLNPDANFAEQPNMILWPVPGFESVYAQVFLMRHRYIADVQDFNSVLELPVRWYDPVIWWLASYFGAELPDVPQDREVYLSARADKELGEAMDEERDNSPIMIQADISAYTR